MNKFFLHTLLFIFIDTLLIVSLMYFTNDHIKCNSKFKISKNINKIIVGHSHPECAFNDSLISGFKNFSKSGESYFYNYYKIVELLKQNVQIKTIFIEFSNNQINDGMDNWIWGEPYLSRSYKLYGPFLDFQANALLCRKNPFGFFNSVTIQLMNNLKIMRSKDYDYTGSIGGYLPLKKNKIDSLLTYSKCNNAFDSTQFKISEKNVSYLKKIVSICKTKKIDIYLVRSPLHKKYSALNNEIIFQKIRKLNFSEVEFLDFKNFPLDNSEYADFEHLNYSGAKKFSSFFNKLLNNKLLEIKNKQEYIDKEMLSEVKAFSIF